MPGIPIYFFLIGPYNIFIKLIQYGFMDYRVHDFFAEAVGLRR